MWRAGGRPPAPPRRLVGRSRAIWREVAGSRPPDYFDAASLGLLEGFCVVSAALEVLSPVLAAAPGDRATVARWCQLARMQATLAVKLRLCPSSAMRADSGRLSEPAAPVADRLSGGSAIPFPAAEEVGAGGCAGGRGRCPNAERGAAERAPYKFEGAARAAIRAELCLGGERSWWKADFAAAETVRKARSLAGHVDPEGWDEVEPPGDIDYRRGTNGHAHPLCAFCAGPITRARPKQGPMAAYCSAKCRMAAYWRRAHPVEAEDRRCAECGELVPLAAKSTARFCSTRCSARASDRRKRALELAERAGRICEECGGPIEPTKDPRSRYCSERCRRRAADRRSRGNGHAHAG